VAPAEIPAYSLCWPLMDVRCEKCQTEYELDEGKLKPGGVTVKCTTCGHMFKVRRRPGSSASTPAPFGDSRPLGDSEDGDRTWLVKLEDGEIKTCRELSTLQKWIVSGRVTRECAISRTGKKWKLLGEIGELASFFAIADEAREARASGRWGGTVTQEYPSGPESKSGGHPRTVPRRSSVPAPEAPFPHSPSAPQQDLLETLEDLKLSDSHPVVGPKAVNAAAAVAAGGMNPIYARTLPLGTPLPPNMRNAQGRSANSASPVHASDNAPTISSPEESAKLARAAEQAAEVYTSAPRAPAASHAKSHAVVAPASAGWAAEGRVYGDVDPDGSGPHGPTGGIARPSKSGEAAFVKAGKLPDIQGEYENGRFVPTQYTEDDLMVPKSRAGLWIVLVSLILLTGAGIAVYLFLYAGGDDDEDSEQAAPAVQATDAAPAAPTPPPTAPGPELDKAMAAANTALPGDATPALEAAAEMLAGLASGPGAAASAPFLVARARVENALAQHLADQARLAAAPAEGKQLLEKSRTRAAAARAAAEAAIALEANNGAALLAMADARRLEGEKTVEVDRLLRQARQSPAAAELAGEVDLVSALLLTRDERLRDARMLFDRLAKAAPAGDVRARYRLALIDLADGNAAAAKSNAEAVVAAQAEHSGARAVLDKLAAPAVPETPKQPDKPAKPDKPSGVESIDTTLSKANKLAENGNCAGAMPLFRKVLDDNPSSVAALTGLGFCHLDRKEYASAHTRFRAALGISSRYQDAMWGIAEMYQRQGNKSEAISKYEAFIEAYPSTRRASAARRQIDKLRAEESGGGDSGETPPDPPAPEPGGGDE
jgi:predicted Zn finger-like uncharacterized protein